MLGWVIVHRLPVKLTNRSSLAARLAQPPQGLIPAMAVTRLMT
jgi:hypothetical protein